MAGMLAAGAVSAGEISVEFRVTHGAGLRLFEKPMDDTGRVPHFEAFREFSLTAEDLGDGYDRYTGTADAPTGLLHYVTGGGVTGFVKQARVFSAGAAMPVTVDAVALDPARRDDNGYMASDLYLNVNDAQHLVLGAGESFNLIPTRVWQAMEGAVGNYFIEPDYEVEVLNGANVLTSQWSGGPGLEYARLTGVSEGTAVVRVTYGPIIIREMGQSGEGAYFNAIDPINTGIVIVSVVADKASADAAGIETNIGLREYDTVYFDRSRGGSADYNFKPTGDGDISVRAHKPIHAGGAVWGGGWSDGVKGSDGSFTVKLYEGRNIVEVSSAGSGFREYHVINAKGIEVARDIKQNGDVSISFRGIKTPLEKIAGIYNPGYGGTCYVEYRLPSGGTVSGDHVQYNLSDVNAVTVTPPATGSVTLTGGVIRCSHMGDPLGSHRSRIGREKVYMNQSAARHDEVYSVMPDITIGADGGQSGPDDSGDSGGGCAAGSASTTIASAFAAALAFIALRGPRRG
jgi:hypothetical protein